MEKLTYNFDGYFNIENDSLPETSGIYVLYEGVPRSDRSFIPKQIVYVGQTTDFSSRVPDHIGEWRLPAGSKLYVTLAKFDEDYLDWAEAALVFVLQPEFNEYLKDEYRHRSTILKIEGSAKLMDPEYVACKGAKA